MSRPLSKYRETWIKWLEPALAVILGLGMFPSFTALSEKIFEAYPSAGHYSGPINFLKLFSPAILLYFCFESRRIPRKAKIALLTSLGIGTMATLIAGATCNFPPLFLREWFVICLGSLCSIALILLPSHLSRITVFLWTSIILLGVAINLAFPELTNFLFKNFFDYHYQVPVDRSVGIHLIGFYDVASLSKLLAWLPWVFGLFCLGSFDKPRHWASFLVLLAICSLLIPITTQRGPVLGMIIGCALATSHQAFQLNRKWILKWIPAAAAIVLVLAWLVIPKNILETRFLAFMGLNGTDTHTVEASRLSSDQRIRIWKLAAKRVVTHPLGMPSPPREDFTNAGIVDAYHSHNIFLEQYASRGWIWGTLHLALWLIAFASAWKDRTWRGTLMTGGVATTFGLGLVDHPWFVLNHAMILGFFLFNYWIMPVELETNRS